MLQYPILYILKIDSKVLELQTITWLTMGHLSSASFSPPSPKPEQFRNRGKKQSDFTMLPRGPTGTCVRVTQNREKVYLFMVDFKSVFFFLQETGNTFYCSMDIKTHYTGEFTICLRFLKHEISYFCSRPLQASFLDLCSRRHSPPLLRGLQLKPANTACTAQNIGLKRWGMAHEYRP